MWLVPSMGFKVFLALNFQIKAFSKTRSGLGSGFREAAGADPTYFSFFF